MTISKQEKYQRSWTKEDAKVKLSTGANSWWRTAS